MQQSFEESRRVLRSDGLYTVVFAHKTTSAWDALVGGLIHSGLQVTASWPVNTERPGRRRAQASAALASSVFLVCRKRDSLSNDGLWDDVRKELTEVVKERLDFFWSQGIRGADFFISAIGPALSVFGRYSRVVRLSGAEVSVGLFLDEVRGLVTNYALTKILQVKQTGVIDAETRFYVIWKWSYGDAKVPADEAFKLAQGLGFDTECMWGRTGVLVKSGENVQATAVGKRMTIKGLGEPNADASPASLIDVLHRLCAFREKSDTQGMAEFLARSGQGKNASFWVVAQAVSEILPDGDKEKQLMQGLLNQREQVEEMARDRQLF
jgi:putative DNA methylase